MHSLEDGGLGKDEREGTLMVCRHFQTAGNWHSGAHRYDLACLMLSAMLITLHDFVIKSRSENKLCLTTQRERGRMICEIQMKTLLTVTVLHFFSSPLKVSQFTLFCTVVCVCYLFMLHWPNVPTRIVKPEFFYIAGTGLVSCLVAL